MTCESETISNGATEPFRVTITPPKLVGNGKDSADRGGWVVNPEPVKVANPPGLHESPGRPLAVLVRVMLGAGAAPDWLVRLDALLVSGAAELKSGVATVIEVTCVPAVAGRISAMVRLYQFDAGAVSFMVTVVPAVAVGLDCI